ncbi:hypothetical protein [Bacillus ndiopicus]|uniref:hypothetical protein n=1 Tax=Bacillus ndiopicus TaxID=1347368 RepID=UPI0005A72CEA|nr:hypothetical protein [Bacillus ndiopicus]
MFIKRILLLCFAVLLLSACGDKEKGFKEGTWGMKMEKVISNEKKVGNELYTEDTSDDDEITIEYEDVVVNGYLADVQYIFYNEISKYLMYPGDFSNDEESIKEFNSLPDDVKFNDFILIEGEYFFRDIDEEDSKEIYESLVAKYGEPGTEDEDSVLWYTEATRIYFNKSDYVSYSASIDSVEDFMKLNKKSNGKKNDL